MTDAHSTEDADERPMPTSGETEPDLEQAIRLALEEHAGQTRKASELPYIVHPIEVTKRLSDLGVTDRLTLCAAALHDVLEDGEVTRASIEARFGSAVGRIVAELTFDESAGTKSDYLASFRERSVQALVIKLVDRGCNVDDFVRARPAYAATYAAKAKSLFDAVASRKGEIVGAFGDGTADALVAEASRLAAVADHA